MEENNPDYSVCPITHAKIGELLSNNYEMLMKIFLHLGYRDLLKSSQVCEYWSYLCRGILLNRRKLRYVTAHPNNLYTTQLQVPDLFRVATPFYKSQVTRDPDTIEKGIFNKREMNVPPHLQVLEDILETVSKSPQTYYCLAFAVGGWLERLDIVTKFSPNGGSLGTLLSSLLSENSELALVDSSGVVGSVEVTQDTDNPTDSSMTEDELRYCHLSNSLNKVGYSIEVEDFVAQMPEFENQAEPMEALSLVLIPRQFGVKIKIFKICETEFYKTYRSNEVLSAKKINLTPEEFNSLCGLNPEDKLKSLLIFSSRVKGLTSAVLLEAQKRQNNKLAIGGGLVDLLQQRGSPFGGTIGVAISGCNVEASSIVIPSSVKNENNFRKALSKLKSRGLPDGHSVAFMFSCCGRGCSWYRRGNKAMEEWVNVESKAFRSFFPNTPLFGFFGGGEIGNNYYSTEEPGLKRQKKSLDVLFHQFSTVFVFLSFL